MCIRHVSALPAQERLPSGVTVLRRPYLPDYRRLPGARLPRSVTGTLRYALAVRRWLAVERFDAIFLNQWPLLHALALSRRARRRAVIDWCEIRDGWVFRLFQELLPRRVAANTAVSGDVRQYIAARSTGPVLTLPSGIARGRYCAGDPATRSGILYLGRLAPHKGVPMLVAAYDALCAAGGTEPLIIAGDGPALGEVQAAMAASPHAARITLEGMVSEERKQTLLAGSRVLVLPSRREGFPRVVAEAIASGLPTVTTRYPGNGTAAVVEEFRCGLCADPTPEAVAAAIAAVLADWDAHSARAAAGAERLDWDVVVAEFEQFLNQVLRDLAVAPGSKRQAVGTWVVG